MPLWLIEEILMSVLPSIDPVPTVVVPSLRQVFSAPTAGVGITVTVVGGASVVRVAGALDRQDLGVLAETLGEASVEGSRLVLDLTAVDSVPSGTASILDATSMHLSRWGTRLSVVGSVELTRTLGAGAPSRTAFHSSLDAALAYDEMSA
ncbi:STAS domain-containing protein [Rhodococcus sp. NPDC078407]|uniref:STAS domain-containing protein n=1 Tax=Rhodococcus sp. NPDC078407 TaxID=3364509 RepID=UPI0037CA2D8F